MTCKFLCSHPSRWPPSIFTFWLFGNLTVGKGKCEGEDTLLVFPRRVVGTTFLWGFPGRASWCAQVWSKKEPQICLLLSAGDWSGKVQSADTPGWHGVGGTPGPWSLGRDWDMEERRHLRLEDLGCCLGQTMLLYKVLWSSVRVPSFGWTLKAAVSK